MTARFKKIAYSAISMGIVAPTLVLAYDSSLTARSVAGNDTPSFMGMFFSLLRFILWIFEIVAIIGLLASLAFYFISRGNEERSKTAKKFIFYSIIGNIIVFGALMLVKMTSATLY